MGRFPSGEANFDTKRKALVSKAANPPRAATWPNLCLDTSKDRARKKVSLVESVDLQSRDVLVANNRESGTYTEGPLHEFRRYLEPKEGATRIWRACDFKKLLRLHWNSISLILRQNIRGSTPFAARYTNRYFPYQYQGCSVILLTYCVSIPFRCTTSDSVAKAIRRLSASIACCGR